MGKDKRNKSRSPSRGRKDLRKKLQEGEKERNRLKYYQSDYGEGCFPREATSRVFRKRRSSRETGSSRKKSRHSSRSRSRDSRSPSETSSPYMSRSHTESHREGRSSRKTTSRSPSYRRTHARDREGRSPSAAISLYSRATTEGVANSTVTKHDGRFSPSTASCSRVLEHGLPSDSAKDYDDSPALLLHDVNDEISEDTRNILGPDPTKQTRSAFTIHKAVEPIWTHILGFGLSKDESDKLFSKYSLPENCTLLTPPRVNPEVDASMNNLHTVRDQTHLHYQTQLGIVLASLGSALNVLLQEERNFPKHIRDPILTNIADSGRMLCSLVNEISHKRRQLIFPLMNKQIRPIVESLPPGEFLFGSGLGEKIQAIKTMEKVGKDIRFTQPSHYRQQNTPFPFQRKKGGGGAERPHTTTSGQLNRRRPTYRKREVRSQRGRPSTWQKTPSNYKGR